MVLFSSNQIKMVADFSFEFKRSQASEVQKIFPYYKQKQKISVFLPTDDFVIDECKLCNKEWKPLAMVQYPTVCVN